MINPKLDQHLEKLYIVKDSTLKTIAAPHRKVPEDKYLMAASLALPNLTMGLIQSDIAKYILDLTEHQEAQKKTKERNEDPEVSNTISLFIKAPRKSPVMHKELNDAFKQTVTSTIDTEGSSIVLARSGDTGRTWSSKTDLTAGLRSLSKTQYSFLSSVYYKTKTYPNGGRSFLVFNANGTVSDERVPWEEYVDLCRKSSDAEADRLNSTGSNITKVSEFVYEAQRNKEEGKDGVAQDIEPFLHYHRTQEAALGFTSWRNNEELTMPFPVILTNDMNEDAFNYINISPEVLKSGPTPNFDGFLTSVHEDVRDMFMACIYSTVHAKAFHPLVVWMHGEGSNGKSKFFEALGRYVGESFYSPIDSQTFKSDFGLDEVIGSRLLVFGDCQNNRLINYPAMHAITGGDQVSVRRKGLSAVKVKFRAQAFVAANIPPAINLNNINETRRILYIPMTEPDEEVMKRYCETNAHGQIVRHSSGQPKFKSYDLAGKLFEEMPAILAMTK